MPRRGPGPAACFLSVVFHVAFIAWVIYFSPSAARRTAIPTLYRQVILPNEKKIIWYHLKDLPRIDPPHRDDDEQTLQAREKRNQVIISASPEAPKADQLVFRPDRENPLLKETPLPNLLAVEAPRTRSAPKPFSPPPPKPVDPIQSRMTAPPEPVAVAKSSAVTALDPAIGRLPKIRRSFVQPPIAPSMAKVRSNIPDLLPPQADPHPGPPGSATAAAQADALSKSLTRLPGKSFVPPGRAPQSTRSWIDLPDPGGGSGSDVTAFILSASPAAELLAKLPEGVRPADISVAPRIGTRSAGVGGNGTHIPGLIIQPGVSQPSRAIYATPPGASILYEDMKIATAHKTLSAPLRPSSRTIPAAIESRFRGRVVYTLVVPMPPLPIYAGDWIMWFAESEPATGSASQMRAPVPVRKFGLITGNTAPAPAGRIKLSARILKSGRVDLVDLIEHSDIPSKKAAVADLEYWQFEPALKDGLPVDVEIIVEIPYR